MRAVRRVTDALTSPSLTGRTVVITGCSSGIGAQAARQLAALGATVCLLARRADELEALRTEIVSAGGSAHAYPVDLTDPDDCAAVAAQLLDDHPVIDELVNNAGRSIRRPIRDSLDRLHDHERVMAINYFGAVRLTSLLLPRFLEQGHGHVTVSSTMSTQLPIPLFSAYLASKSALESYARSLMAELGHCGVTTTIVYFPMVRTEMSGATAIYSAMPMLTAEVAGTWIVKAVTDHPTRVTSLQGAASQLGMSVLPGVLSKVTAPMFRRMDATLARRSRS